MLRWLHSYFIGSHRVSLIICVILWNQYVNAVTFPCIVSLFLFSLIPWIIHASHRHTATVLGALVYFVKSPAHFVAEQRRICFFPCGAYRIPLLWSKAGIMEAGCSDMRATTNCNTSWRFSSCRQTKGGWKNRRRSSSCLGWDYVTAAVAEMLTYVLCNCITLTGRKHPGHLYILQQCRGSGLSKWHIHLTG